jgi:hypothetical protein
VSHATRFYWPNRPKSSSIRYFNVSTTRTHLSDFSGNYLCSPAESVVLFPVKSETVRQKYHA